MSLLVLENHNENVYNLVQPEPVYQPKPPRYKSTHAKVIRQEYQAGKASHKTMGEAQAELSAPEDYLRKNTRSVKFAQRAKSARTHRENNPPCPAKSDGDGGRRAPVPKVTDHIATPMRSRKNYVQRNALDVMLSEPVKIQDPVFVDDPCGNKQPLKTSGLVPNFVEKRDFGRVPNYLVKLKKEKGEERKKYEEEQREMERQRKSMQLQEHERTAILEGLRANWSELHHQYQGLSLLTDTLPKKNRREKLEHQMDEIEKFIDLIEKNPIIIVSDNPYLFM